MAQHKLAQTGLLARTASPVADVVAMAAACAESQQSDWFRGIGPVSVVSRGANRLELAGMGGVGNRFRQILFTLSTATNAGDTVIRTKITWYRTSQSTVMGFIPAGPKTMLGFKTYDLFLTRLKATLLQDDRDAQVQIATNADSLGVPSGGRS